MAWGYARGFVIEHDNTVKRRIDCKDCDHYEREDKSCRKRPLYLPVDGYNSWRTCDFFELDPTTSHYDEKKAQFADVLRKKQAKRAAEQKAAVSKPSASKQSVSKPVGVKTTGLKTAGVTNTIRSTAQSVKPKTNLMPQPQTRSTNHGYRLFAYENGKLKKGLRHEYISIITDKGSRKKVQIAFDDLSKTAYVNAKVYTQEAIEKVRKLLN